MFCNHCGKEVPNGAKFCNYCGKTIGLQPTNDTGNMQMQPQSQYNSYQPNNGASYTGIDKKTTFMYAMLAVTTFIGLGFFLPLVSSGRWSVGLLEWTMDADALGIKTPILYLMAIVTLVLGLVSAFCAGRCLLYWWRGVRRYDLVNQSLLATWCQIVSVGAKYIMVGIINDAVDWEIFHFTGLAWLVLIAGFVNIFVLVKGYLGEKIGPSQSGQFDQENQRITSEKRCLICKTTYVLGNACPKCGSKSVE